MDDQVNGQVDEQLDFQVADNDEVDNGDSVDVEDQVGDSVDNSGHDDGDQVDGSVDDADSVDGGNDEVDDEETEDQVDGDDSVDDYGDEGDDQDDEVDDSWYDWILKVVAIHNQVNFVELQESLDLESVEYLIQFAFQENINLLFVYREDTLGMPRFSISDKEEPDKLGYPGIFIFKQAEPNTEFPQAEMNSKPILFGEVWKREGQVISSPFSDQLYQTDEDDPGEFEEQRVTIGSEYHIIEHKIRRLEERRSKDQELEEQLSRLSSPWKKLEYLKKLVRKSQRDEKSLAMEYESLYDIIREEQKRILPTKIELDKLAFAPLDGLSEDMIFRFEDGQASPLAWSLLDALQIIRHKPLAPVTITPVTALGQEAGFIQPSLVESTQILQMDQEDFSDELYHLQRYRLYSINDETLELLEPYMTFSMPDGRSPFADFDGDQEESEIHQWLENFYAYASKYRPVSQSKHFVQRIGRQLQTTRFSWMAAKKETTRLESTFSALEKTFPGKEKQKLRALRLQPKGAASPSFQDEFTEFFSFLNELRELEGTWQRMQWNQAVHKFPEMKVEMDAVTKKYREAFHRVMHARMLFKKVTDLVEKLSGLITVLEELTQPYMKERHLDKLLNRSVYPKHLSNILPCEIG